MHGVSLALSLFFAASLPLERVAPLDSDPSLASTTPLHRACAPGEALVVRGPHGTATTQQIALQAGQFVTCVGNVGQQVRVADGPGTVYTLDRGALTTTQGFPREWNACDRDVLVWAYSHDTLILRESLCGSFEGNFMYLLLGDESAPRPRALLIDSGTGYADIKPSILPLVGKRELVAVSTHNHWDHFGGHRGLQGHATLVGHQPPATYDPFAPYDLPGLQAFFGLRNWPDGSADYDLGNRVVTVLPIPGHTADAVAFYDAREELLFTSDSVTPGILFIEDWQHAVGSLKKLERFAQEHPIKWVLGGHIEMSALRSQGTYQYFFYGRPNHSGEHPLQLTANHITDVRLLMEQVLADAAAPHYDARKVEHEFHSQPFVAVPAAGVDATYYTPNTDRLLNVLRQRLAR